MKLPKPNRDTIKKLLPSGETLHKAASKLSPSKIKKRVIAGTVAAATAVSLLTSAAASDPADLLKEDKLLNDPPVAIVETFVPDLPPDDDGGDLEAMEEEDEKKRYGLRSRIRALLMRMPIYARFMLCIPMWAIGWAISSGAGAALTAAAGPVAGAVLQTAVSAAAVFGLSALSVKTVAPDVPVKKLLNKKTAAIALLAAVCGEIAFILLELFLPQGQRVLELVKSLAALLVLLGVAVPLCVKAFRKSMKEEKTE